MPKKEEILEKNDKLNKEKISENTAVLEKGKKAKTTKSASDSKTKKSTTTKKAEKTVKPEEKKPKAKNTTKSATKTTKKSTTKKVEEKKVATAKKETASKPKTTKTVSKKTEKVIDKDKPKTTEKNKTAKVEKVEKVKEEQKIDELSVIEKIKSFIAKIAAMQEEARKESLAEKEEKTTKSSAKTKTAKESKSKTKSKVQSEKEVKKFEYMLEYYDLPYRYNETIVKILAQTPKRMFVYWDISDNDREKYIKTFGEDFFVKTYPVLLLYNEDKKYVREIPINDFANSWYIDIPDPKTKYSIQLGRKFKTYDEVVHVNMQKVQENQIILHTDYLPFANSNVLEVPNDHVLLESLPRFIKFRNVRTNEETMKELKDIKNIFGNDYDVKGFYEEHYKEELSEGMFDMANPSSNLSSSSFK